MGMTGDLFLEVDGAGFFIGEECNRGENESSSSSSINCCTLVFTSEVMASMSSSLSVFIKETKNVPLV